MDTCLTRENGSFARGFSPGAFRLRPAQLQAVPQAVIRPPGQTTGAPAAQVSKRHPCSPARPFGHSSTQREPAAQLAWQLPSLQAKRQTLFGPQLQLPFMHSPSQAGFWPAHSTWQGPAAQENSQELPVSQRQVPFAQVPVQSVLGPQST
jgi:hypothetical protein